MNEGSRICLHNRGSCSRTCAECTSQMVLCNTWAKSRAKAVEQDLTQYTSRVTHKDNISETFEGWLHSLE